MLNENSRFSEVPQVDIGRSTFDETHTHTTTLNAGKLVPIFCQEVLPGDTFSLNTATVARMSTPIYPVMDDCYVDTYYFFVPNRLTWSHWKEFMGENSTGYWIPQTDYYIPQLNFTYNPETKTGDNEIGSVADYFGVPVDQMKSFSGSSGGYFSVNALPFRAYVLIWNEWFRDQNVMQPAYFYTGDEDRTYSGITVSSIDDILQHAIDGGPLLPVSKYHDYFTSCLPGPQKGPDVNLPLSGLLEVISGDVNPNSIAHSTNNVMTDITPNSSHNGAPVYISSGGNGVKGALSYTGAAASQVDYTDTNGLHFTNLYANLGDTSNAFCSIAALRNTFQIQKFYEQLARGGSRYRELLKSMFDVTSPDASMQVPEYLGGKRVIINMDQVVQTSSTDSVSPQGNVSAFSHTSDMSDSFTKSFTEHGFVIGVSCVRTRHSYQQGLQKFWSRRDRLDYYFPVFANISEQPVYNKEIFLTGTSSDNEVFGYQEAWADYRYGTNRVSGLMHQTKDNLNLSPWHYADFYSSLPTLSQSWMQETTANIDRTLAVQSSLAHQFEVSYGFQLKCTRVMPVYSVPGLTDHH